MGHPLFPGRQAAEDNRSTRERRDVRRHERDHRHAGVLQEPRVRGDRPRPGARPRPRRPVVHRRDEDGRHHRDAACIWSYKGLDRTLSTVSIADGLLYIADVAGRVHCLDAETGQCYWVYETQGDGLGLDAGGRRQGLPAHESISACWRPARRPGCWTRSASGLGDVGHARGRQRNVVRGLDAIPLGGASGGDPNAAWPGPAPTLLSRK